MKSTKQNSGNLYEKLAKLKDFRRAQGRMHELRMVLIIIIMAIMSGYQGVRATGDFVKRNRKDLIKLFKPKDNRLPSHQTMDRVLQNVNFKQLSKIFKEWAIQYIKIEDKDWISIDGKAIGSTISNVNNRLQKFISLVSVFASKRKQVISVGKINNSKESEIPKVRELIKQLDLEGVVFTLDALHCQKKQLKS